MKIKFLPTSLKWENERKAIDRIRKRMKENMQEKKQNVAQYGIINGKGNNTSIKDKRQKKTTDVMKVRLNM